MKSHKWFYCFLYFFRQHATLTYHFSKKHVSSRPLNKPSIPCGNSVIRKSMSTATNSIVVRSVRRWHFDGLCCVMKTMWLLLMLKHLNEKTNISNYLYKIHIKSMSHFKFCMPMASSNFWESLKHFSSTSHVTKWSTFFFVMKIAKTH